VIYTYLLLGIPAFYHSRLTRIFTEEGTVSIREIRSGIRETVKHGKSNEECPKSPIFEGFKTTWKDFVDSMVEEWKTLNFVSALLLPSILTMLSMDRIAKDPWTCYTAMFSMLFAFISLVFGFGYIVGFNAIRDAYKGLKWVEHIGMEEGSFRFSISLE
jgi:hypothetical protein